MHPEPYSHADLTSFIVYAIYRTRWDLTVVIFALLLIQRLKLRQPQPHVQRDSGRSVFLASFIIAGKILVDEQRANKTWVEIAQYMYPLRVINQEERAMCELLDWDLRFDGEELTEFWWAVTQCFGMGRFGVWRWPLICDDRNPHSHDEVLIISLL